jgi:hypothetical protein
MAWVIVPAVAWTVTPLWWWTLCALIVIAVGLGERPQTDASTLGWFVFGCVAVYVVHRAQPLGVAGTWITYMAIHVTALALIVERGDWRWLKTALLIVAWIQLPVIALQAFHVPVPWGSVGSGLTGTLGRRAIAASVLALASMWSTDRRLAWGFGLASLMTGSLMGVISLFKMLWKWRALLMPIALCCAILGWSRLALRLDAWAGLWPPRGLLTGWGFLPLPGGFAYTQGTWNAAPFIISDYHCAVLDWMTRTGLIGMLIMVGMGVWAHDRWHHAVLRWSLVWCAWTLLGQSVEQNAMLMICVGLVVVRCLQQRSEDAVAST